MKFCNNCGAQVAEGSKFCTECGQRLQQMPAAPAVEAPVSPVYEVSSAPVNEAPAPRNVDSAAVQVYGQAVDHEFSEPIVSESDPSAVHTYGAPVNHNFTPPVQAEVVLTGTYGAPAAAQVSAVEPAAVPASVQSQYTQATTQTQNASVSCEIPAAVPANPEREQRSLQLPKLNLGGNKGLRIGILAVIVIALVALLFSCFGGGDKNDLNLGTYNAVSCTYSGMELGAEGEWIELRSGGNVKIMLMGDEYSGKWELQGETITVKQAGDTFTGTLKDGTIVIDFGGMIYTYVHEDYKAPTEGNQGTKETKPQQPSVIGYWTLLKSEGDSDMAMDEETVKMLKELGIEIYLDLKPDGTGIFMIEDPISITWDEKELTDDEGGTYAYSLAGDQLTLEVDGAIMYFIHGEGSAPEAGVPGNEVPESGHADPMLNFWEGDWYGWWVVWTADGTYSAWEDQAWDAYAHIDVNDDYTGTVTLWEVDSSRQDPIAVVDVTFRSGVSEYGCMVSESGWFMDCEVGHADWNLDVGASMVRMFDRMIAIDSYYYEPDNSDNNFNYVFILRPWGMDWEDVRDVDAEGTYYSDMMPLEYENWYLPLIEGGVETMPDSHQDGLDLIG